VKNADEELVLAAPATASSPAQEIQDVPSVPAPSDENPEAVNGNDTTGEVEDLPIALDSSKTVKNAVEETNESTEVPVKVPTEGEPQNFQKTVSLSSHLTKLDLTAVEPCMDQRVGQYCSSYMLTYSKQSLYFQVLLWHLPIPSPPLLARLTICLHPSFLRTMVRPPP
jgi:hypothetical protein